MFGRKNKNIPEQGRVRRPQAGGRSSSPTFSYYANRPPDVAAPRTTPNRQMGSGTVSRPKQQWRLNVSATQLPALLLIIVVIICIGKILFLSTNPKLVMLGKSSVTGTYAQSDGAYTAAAHKLLASSVTNHTKLTADVTGVANALERQFPELQSVSITLPLTGNRPIVYAQVAEPSVVLQTGAANYALSRSGVVLAKLESLPNGVPTLTDQFNDKVAVGKQIVPGSTIDFIQTVAQQFVAAKTALATFVLPSNAPFELDTRLEGKAYSIRYNLQADARQQSGAALATMASLNGANPASYIDVRVPERVYYK